MKKTTLRQAALKLAIVTFVLLSPLGLRAQSLLFSEDFEGGSMPTGWTTDGNGTWSVATGDYSTSTGAGNGTYNAKITHGSTGNVTKLITPEIDLSGATSAVLSYMHVQRSWSGDIDELRVYYRTSSSDSWTLLDGQVYTNAVASWTTEEDINLPNLSSTYQIAFEYTDNYGYGVGIDNIVITIGASCPKPTNLTYNATDELATLSWTSDAESWNLKYKVADDADYTEETGLTTTSYEISVAPQTTYQWMVQAVCSGTPGDYTNPASFTTPCPGITTFPWTETFNSLTAGIPNCWDNSKGTTTTESYKWNYYATGHDGAGLRFNSYNNSNNLTNILKTPLMDFPAGQVMQLVFWYKNPTGGDFSVYISTDGGSTYTTALATGLTGQSTWKEKEINLTDYVGAENVVIVFKGTSNYGSGDAYIYLDDVTVRQAPSCLAPTGLAATPSTSSAELSWTANSGETAWTLYWKKTTDENYTEVANATNPYTLNDLTAATNYQYYVVANCAADDASEPSAVFPFTTECAVIPALGYSENFDTYTAGNNVLPICWSYINTTTNSTYAAFPRVYNTNANSAPNCLYFYSYSYPSSLSYYDPQPQYAILPEMSDLAGKQVTLQARGSNSSSTYKIGTMSDPTDTSTFTIIAEQALTTSYQEFEHIIPTDAPGNYLAIMMDAASGYNNTTRGVYIDDIQITEVPTCRKPSALMLETLSSRTAHTATLKWTNGEDGQNAWQIAYSTSNSFAPDPDFTPGDNEWLVDADNNPFELTNLNQSTTYYAYVRANCGSEDGMSAWCINKATFTTLAGNNAPTGLAVPDITVSSSSAIATWNANAANELHQFYELYISNDATAPTAESTPSYITTDTSFTFTGLDPETEYYVWVRDDCGTDGYSAWLGSVSFTTQASCPTPVLNDDGITNITAHTADVEWSNFTENTNYEVSYRTAAYFDGVTEEFGTTPTGWARYTGLLNENGTATLTSATSWSFDSNNGVFDNHARVNIYGNYQKWLVTPDLTVPENGALTFDMALTVYSSSSSASPTAGSQADDKFVVLITTDGRATWEILRQWDNAGSEYVYDEITNAATGEHVTIDLSAFEGLDVQVAFYGESTVSGGDNNLHIDNVGVGVAVAAGEWETENVTENSLQLINLVAETPYDVKVAGYCDAAVGGESDTLTFTTAVACPAPTELSVVGDATTNSVDLTWTMNGAETDWQICINGDEENLVYINESAVPINNNTVSYTLTGLIPGQDYTFKVRANCEASVTGDGTSDWSNTVSIQTEATCTEPTAFNHGTPDVHSVDLTWTESGTATQWQLCVNDDMDNLILLSSTDDDVNVDGQNVSYTLSGLTGTTNYSVKVRAYCAAGDGNQSPWVGPTEFRTACEAITTFPWSENFESYAAGNFSDPCWVNELISGNGTQIFKIYTSTNGDNSTHQLQLPDMNSGTMTKLVLPEMTLPNANYQFTIDVYRTNSTYSPSDNPYEGIRVFASTDGEIEGATELAFIPRQYNEANGSIPAEAAAGWYTYELPIGMSGNCYIILRGESRYCSATYMDNFVVEVAPTCRKPKTPVCDSKTAHTATLSWTNGEEDQNAWQVAYSTDATFNPEEGTIVDVTTNPATISGLTQSTTYYAYVRANCGDEDGMSSWCINKVTFSTLAGNNAPTAFAVNGITSNSATASWTGNTANDLHQLYELYFSTDATAPTDDTEPTHNSNEASYTFTGLTPETQYFVWVRDNCGDDGYSTWVGSASFTTLELCPTPTDLVANNITNNAATVSWNDVNDSYNVRYRVAAGLTPIFSEDFSNDIGDWTMQNCHASTGVNNGVFRFYWNTNPPQYLISPEITGINSDAVVEFNYWNGNSSYDETFQVGLSSTTNDVDAFSWSETITAAGEIHYTYHATVPVGTKYIAIKLLSNDQLYLYIDDIVIGEPVNAGEWNEIDNITENSVDLVGLTAETKYEAQVQGVCSSLSMNTEWTDTLSFTTKSFREKEILANRWYAISSPMHNDGNNETLAGVNNLTSGTYDLYGYNEGDGTWEKPTTSLNRGKGYIYRRSEGTTLQFVGDANTGSVSVSLTSSCSDNDLKGFNLIGNPYPHAVAISQPHYTLNPNGTWTAHTSNNTIGVAEAFLVYSTYSPNTYYFSDVTPSTPSKGNTASAALAFTVSNGEYSDVAYARFDNGEGLPKIAHLAANAPMLSIPVEGRRYAIANLGSDCESFDMVFRGTGTYTLSFNGNSSYCHLVDRVAGKDIDMLRQNYTFSSNGFDADRFTVKLSPDAQENANGNFAYWNGNVWMVEGNGTLQVFDALGRQLLSQEISNSNFEIQNSLFPAAGVYVLRMGEKTQKIVVR